MTPLQQKTCCFTGHRSVPPEISAAILKRAETVIRRLYDRGYRYFGVGGAVGFDSQIAQLLFRLRKNVFQDIRVILVYPFEGYTKLWTAEQQWDHRQSLALYDKTVCVSDTPGRETFLARNRHLVNGSSVCVCYCVDESSGTGYTVRYAREKGLEIINLA